MSRDTHRLRIVALGVALLSIGCGLARASDDAGTQSVFGYGAGNRALAMGSAFVAAADDASAMYWNPAGLGMVRRSELLLNQSAQMGLGFSESYFAMALPSWRWGTLGVTLRRFGADGIEQRDDRNVITGENLSDSELEMAVGYGRSFREIWGVGGALKLQRQSLAGFSASGVGLDLGMSVSPRWMDGMRWGLSVRNALEPALRLDRESVPDPMTVRSGVGYQLPLHGASGLMAELDLEKPRGAAQRVHAGMEYRLLDLASLRVGMNGSALTAGTGVQWRDFVLDYTFENNAIAPSHRVGVSMRLGPTVEQRRLASRRREDEALERRLADAFQERQSHQVEDLMARGAAAHARSQFDEALDALGAVLTIDPGNAAAVRLQVACFTGKAAQLEQSGDFAAAAATYDLARNAAPADTAAAAGAARCRAESDRKAERGAHIRELFAGAMDALATEDYAAARDRFAQVLAEDPNDSEAARMQVRAEQALTRRASRLVEAANRDVHAGRLSEAAAELDQAAALDRHASGLDAAVQALARAKQTAESVARAPRDGAGGVTARATAAPVSTMSDREVEALYGLGLAALKAQRPDDALRYWEHVWAERPGYREVGAFLKREYLARGMEAFASGKLEDAVTLWEKVLHVDPNDARAQGYLARAQKQIARSREILGLDR